MDPLAHTLVGATLAESGLRRWTPLATATLVLGANAPDLDVLAAFGGRDEALYWRRGHTHGVLAMVILPVAVTGLMLAWDRGVRRRLRPDAPSARAGPLWVLALLSVLTHPILDWLNTYGVRLLMPFDGRWFYGDTLFIIDPWLWLLAAAAVVLARSSGWMSGAAWLLLGCAATALVTLTPFAPTGARIAWSLGLGAIVLLRLRTRAPSAAAPRVAGVCLVGVALYAGAMLGAGRVAEARAAAWLAEQAIDVQELAAGPEPADPFRWDVIARAEDRYHFVEVAWLADRPLRFSHEPIPIGRGAAVQAALRAPEVRGLRHWLRFPSFAVEPTEEGTRVTIRDVRYSRTGGTRLGTAVVELGPDLEPR